MDTNAPQFAETWCSQCGAAFGPGDHGYSTCGQHRRPTYATELHLMSDRQRSKAFAWEVAHGLRDDANHAADNAERMLLSLKGLGIPATTTESVKDALRDAFSDAQGTINKVLDDAGCNADSHQIDMDWLRAA